MIWLLLLLVLMPTVADAQQVVLTVREQQVLKTLFGTSGFIEQLIVKETASQPVLSSPGFARIMADSATHTLLCSFNGGAYSTCIGGATGTVTNTGTLTLNQLVLGNGGVDIKSLGSAGTSTQVLHGGAPPTWSAIVSADLNITTTSCGAGQHVSAISSGGVGTCTADTGATPGGSNTQVQFNNAGAFGGSANLTFVSPTLTSGTGDQFAIFDTLQAGSQRTVVVGGTSGAPLTTRGGVLEVFKTTSLTSVDASCANAGDFNCGAAAQVEHRALGATQAVQITGLNVSASSASTVASPGGDVVAVVGKSLKTANNAGTNLAAGGYFQGIQQGVTAGRVVGVETSATWDVASDCPYSTGTFPGCIGVHVVANNAGRGTKASTAIYVNSADLGVETFDVGLWLTSGAIHGVGIDDRTNATIGYRIAGAKTTGIDLTTGTFSSKAIALSSSDLSDSSITWDPSGMTLEGFTPSFFPGTTNTGSLGVTGNRWNSIYGVNLFLGVASSADGRLILSNATNANTFTIQPGVTASNLTFTLPTADGAVGTCLSTNGSGVLGWANCSSGGTGLTSLGGQTGATQTFANDTNVQMVSAADVHTLTWAGTLATSRGGLGGNFSASSGVLSVNSGTVIANNILTAGFIPFAAAGNTLASTANFAYDNANTRLNIGGSAVAFTFNITSTSARGDGIHVQGDATNTLPCLNLKSTGAAAVRSWCLGVDGADSGRLKIIDNTAVATRVTIDSSGLVVLGSTTFTERLNLDGGVRSLRNDGGYALKLARTSAPAREYGLAVDSGTGGLAIDDVTAAARRITMDTAGSVGIGVLSPLQLLHVGGQILASSSITTTAGNVTASAGGFFSNNQSGLTLFRGSAGVSGEVRFVENDGGSNYVGFKAPDSISANIMWKLPTTDSTGTQCLASNGGGTLSWSACSGGSVSGSGASGRVAFWSGASSLASNAGFTWDDTNGGQGLVKVALNSLSLLTITPTISGDRSGPAPFNGIGTIPIPPLLFGVGGAQATTLVPGLVVNLTDSSTYSTTTPGNVGNPSAAAVIQKTMTGAYAGEGVNLLVQTIEERTRSTWAGPENIAYGIFGAMTLNSATGSGDTNPVHGAGLWLDTSRHSTINTSSGIVVRQNNFVNDQNSTGIQISAGDVAGVTVGTEFTNGVALVVSARNARNTVDAWTNAFVLGNPDGSSRIRIDNNGVLRLATVAGLETVTLDGSVPDISPVFNNSGRVGHSGNIWNEIWSANVFATTYRTTGGGAGLSATLTVRDAGGGADCTITIDGGIVTGTTC